jgi:hypothetical protein
MEYEFEDLAIKVGAVHVGWFRGSAYLQAERGGFRIANVCLDGPGIVWLLKAAETALERELRVAIEAALLDVNTADGRHVRDAWAAHCESERADAA